MNEKDILLKTIERLNTSIASFSTSNGSRLNKLRICRSKLKS